RRRGSLRSSTTSASDCLQMAFFALKRDAASGVDGLTWPTYEADLDRNLTDLHERVHRGAYQALPSRRVYIPKPDGRQRPLAVAALEDKIVQGATELLWRSLTHARNMAAIGKEREQRRLWQQVRELMLQEADVALRTL